MLPGHFTAVGSYIFAGGFTIGVQQHFNVLCHLEDSDYGVATCRRNMPDMPIYYPSHEWPIETLKDIGHTDFVYGNPPCAAWSVAGYTSKRRSGKWRNDPRVACTTKFFGLLSALRPTIWAWESVTQAWTQGHEFVADLIRKAAALGYSSTILLHNANHFGLPQTRKRFFLVCHNIEFTPIIPNWFLPAPGPAAILATASEAARNAEPCWGKGKGKTEGAWTSDIIAKIPPGTRLSKWWEKNIARGAPATWKRNRNGSVKGRPSFGHFRCPVHKPTGAVIGYGIIHPIEHRFISTQEMQLLSGFPPDYIFTGATATLRASEMARGVCPPVGEWLAHSAHDAMMRGIIIDKPVAQLYDLRKPRTRVKAIHLTTLDRLSTPTPMESAELADKFLNTTLTDNKE